MRILPTLIALSLIAPSVGALGGNGVVAVAGDVPGELRPGELRPVERGKRLELRGLCGDVARLGDEAAFEELVAVLVALGDDPAELEPFLDRWRRNLERPRPGRDRRAAIADQLSRLANRLGEELGERAPEPRHELAELILRLDSDCEVAARAAGRVEYREGWAKPAYLERVRQRERVADLLRRAQHLSFDLEEGYDEREVVLELFGRPVPSVRFGGRISLVGPLPHRRLARILRSALRGAALSNALLGGELELPRLRQHGFLLPGDTAKYRAALDESLAADAIDPWEYEAHDALKLESYIDLRGWRTCNRRPEADYAALVLMDLLGDWVPRNSQPTLVAGHLNWICLSVFGTKMPLSAIPPEGLSPEGEVPGSSAELSIVQRRRGLWRVAQTGLAGCRLWLVEAVREGRNPPWVRSMQDHVGKIVGEPLLKTTLVAEYLHERGRMRWLLERTRGSAVGPRTYERALEEPLEAFEERWTEWLLNEGGIPHPGVAQHLAADAKRDQEVPEPPLVKELRRLRQAAMGDVPPEFPILEIYEDLSRGARAHAQYLVRHRDQLTRWPDAHEEYPDREGFSAEGSRAGLKSIIWPGNASTALEAWMGTFYHRLPLLDPGLVGVGFGAASEVVVLDVSSLVLRPWREHWVAWPPDGARDIPLQFRPELPSPVPTDSQSEWGYPVTLQVFGPLQKLELRIEPRLWKMTGRKREPVACHVITPEAPHNPELVPLDAWCLIPKRSLEPGTTYVFEARVEGESLPRRWEFETVD